MSKKLFLAIGLAIAIIFSFSVTLSFATENTMQNAGNDVVNGVRDVVGGAENAVEDALKGVGDGINDMTNMNNNNNNANTNTTNNTNNNDIMTGIGNDANTAVRNTTGYNATRTATDANTTNFLGMNSTMWTWLIIAVATAVIIALYTAGSRTSCFNRFSGSSKIADAGLRNTFFILSSTLMLSFICKRYCGVPPTIPYIRAISSAENPLKYLQLSSKSNGSIFIWAVLLPYKGALYASTLSSM